MTDHFSAFMELLLPNRRKAAGAVIQFAAALMYASVIAGKSRVGSVIVNLEIGAVPFGILLLWLAIRGLWLGLKARWDWVSSSFFCTSRCLFRQKPALL